MLSHGPIGACRMEDYLRTIGEMISLVGSRDPRLDIRGRTLKPLADLLKAYCTEDPPPDRVKPLPIQLIKHAVKLLQQS